MRTPRFVLVAAPVALAVATALLTAGPAWPAPGEPRVVEITAKRFQFTPGLVTLKKGEPVLLRLHSEDVVHGFFQRSLGIDTTIPPGRVTELSITPREAGKFLVICHHFCGAGHGGMKMTFVVE